MNSALLEALRSLAKARGLESPDKVLARQPEPVVRSKPWRAK